MTRTAYRNRLALVAAASLAAVGAPVAAAAPPARRREQRRADMQRAFEQLPPKEKNYAIEIATRVVRLSEKFDPDDDNWMETDKNVVSEFEAALDQLRNFHPEGWDFAFDLTTLHFFLNHAKDDEEMETSPAHDLPEEFAAIEERGLEISRAMETVTSLGLEGVDTQLRVAGLHEIAVRCESLARNLGLQAIAEGSMTQVQLAKLLDVHKLTVHRWVKDTKEETE